MINGITAPFGAPMDFQEYGGGSQIFAQIPAAWISSARPWFFSS